MGDCLSNTLDSAGRQCSVQRAGVPSCPGSPGLLHIWKWNRTGIVARHVSYRLLQIFFYIDNDSLPFTLFHSLLFFFHFTLSPSLPPFLPPALSLSRPPFLPPSLPPFLLPLSLSLLCFFFVFFENIFYCMYESTKQQEATGLCSGPRGN